MSTEQDDQFPIPNNKALLRNVDKLTFQNYVNKKIIV
jgi:hypothetical protein